uniref:Uncharacterized protein n=1 Tax=Meloidogyne incognita TaxID=6306 RepID=A0A914LS88_MELIC
MVTSEAPTDFPPPPPYNVVTTTTAAARISRGCQNPPKECNCVASSELQMALERFRVYKRALGTTIFVGFYYIIYLALIGYFFKCHRDHIIALIVVGSMCLLAIWGCLKQNSAMLFPMFLMHIVSFITFLTAFVFTVFCLFDTNHTYWDKIVDQAPQLQQLANALYSLGLGKRQAIFVLMTFWLFCAMAASMVVSTIWTLLDKMPMYCSELHKIALSMFGNKTDLKNPTLVKHLRMHVRARALGKAQTTTV